MAVTRGLLATQVRGAPGMRAVPWRDRVERRMADLRHPGLQGTAWRELADQFSELAGGGPDHLGRRVYTDAGRMDCRYVARMARRGARREELTEVQWAHLRASLGRVYCELEEGLGAYDRGGP